MNNMNLNQYLPAMMLAMFVAAPLALAGDRPAEDAKPLSEIAAALEKQGYVIYEAEHDDRAWEIEALRDDTRFEFDIDARTGETLSKVTKRTTATPLPVDIQPLSQIAATLEQAGYVVAEVDFKHRRSVWEIDAYKGNREYDLKVDAATGEILSAREDR